VAGPKKKILEFSEDFAKITFPVQFELLCKALEGPPTSNVKDIGD
jgi:hypothetical protein